MSRIGNTPIKIPEGVKIDIDEQKVTVRGKLGKLYYTLNKKIKARLTDKELIIERENDNKKTKALHGLSRALLNNMVNGVYEGFEKKLHVVGVGYSAEVIGPWLKLVLGYAHDILLEIPKNIEVKCEKIPRRKQGKLPIQSVISVKGIDKENLGKFAAEIRSCRPPENYKGKGIRYEGEYVQIKPGKTATATASA